MAELKNREPNACAYCLKPVSDHFICQDCMNSRNVSMEKLSIPSEQKAQSLERARRKGEKQWKDFPLHKDFEAVKTRQTLVKWLGLIPVSIVSFGISTLFGFPDVLAFCAAAILSFGWIIYRQEQCNWYRYASWLSTNGNTMECEVDLVSSGELDQPYVVLKDENRISLVYETRVFKVVFGDAKELLTGLGAPGAKTAFVAKVHYDKELSENAVAFEFGKSRLWCKAHLSRGL